MGITPFVQARQLISAQKGKISSIPAVAEQARLSKITSRVKKANKRHSSSFITITVMQMNPTSWFPKGIQIMEWQKSKTKNSPMEKRY
jgi:hypothetical protein